MKKSRTARGPSSLLWESLRSEPCADAAENQLPGVATAVSRRLPYDRRCAAKTKSGKRCRGTIREGTEYCVFHDPSLAAVRIQRQAAARDSRRRNKLSILPDGYLRRLTSRRGVGQALDRLYREIRVERMTVEMGRVLLDILARLMDAGLCEDGRDPQSWNRTKAKRLRPKLEELLTEAEKSAWRRAVQAGKTGGAFRGDVPIKPVPRADSGRSAPTVRPALTIAS